MVKKISASFLLAFHNIRSHFFHTLLSILGIVIGVAALVAMLSFIDGLEKFAKEQIRSTSSLNAVVIRTETHKWVNEVRVAKDTVTTMRYDQLMQLKASLKHPAQAYMWLVQSGEAKVTGSDKPLGTHARATGEHIFPDAKAEAGRLFDDQDIEQKKPYAIVNSAFVRAANSSANDVLGKTVIFKEDTLKVIGVLFDEKNKIPTLFFPITRMESGKDKFYPDMAFEAATFEDVNPIKDEIAAWLKLTFRERDRDFSIVTNDFRLQQAEKGFLLFKVIMGLIVGISVVVGGIGVMNVLLISVTQRTVEIGVRKAVGANRRDIILQFLSESITVSAFGSLMGLVLGILVAMAAVPIIRAFVEVPFEAAYTWSTFVLITVLSLVVGIVFGTYPAIRASRLDPVEAIRHE
jgi:putative ABC transport system permease protein